MSEKIEMQIDSDVMNAIFKHAFFAQKHFDSEIAGWGHATAEKGIYKLAPLTKQVVSGAEVETFPNELLNDPKYDISDMLVQWHSHVNMGVFWSGVDEANIKESVKLMGNLLSIVVNCRNEYKARFDTTFMGNKLPAGKMFTFEIELKPYYSDPRIEADVLGKVSKKIYIPAVYTPPASRVYPYMEDYKDIFFREDEVQEKAETIITSANIESKKVTPRMAYEKIYEIAVKAAGNLTKDFDLQKFKEGIYVRYIPNQRFIFIYPKSSQDARDMLRIWNKFVEDTVKTVQYKLAINKKRTRITAYAAVMEN